MKEEGDKIFKVKREHLINITFLRLMLIHLLVMFPAHRRLIDSVLLHAKLSAKAERVIWEEKGEKENDQVLFNQGSNEKKLPFCDSCLSTFSWCSQPTADLSRRSFCTPNFPPKPKE